MDEIANRFIAEIYHTYYRTLYRNALLYLLLFTALNYCYLNGLSSS